MRPRSLLLRSQVHDELCSRWRGGHLDSPCGRVAVLILSRYPPTGWLGRRGKPAWLSGELAATACIPFRASWNSLLTRRVLVRAVHGSPGPSCSCSRPARGRWRCTKEQLSWAWRPTSPHPTPSPPVPTLLATRQGGWRGAGACRQSARRSGSGWGVWSPRGHPGPAGDAERASPFPFPLRPPPRHAVSARSRRERTLASWSWGSHIHIHIHLFQLFISCITAMCYFIIKRFQVLKGIYY